MYIFKSGGSFEPPEMYVQPPLFLPLAFRLGYNLKSSQVYVGLRLCVCVCERERESEVKSRIQMKFYLHSNFVPSIFQIAL